MALLAWSSSRDLCYASAVARLDRWSVLRTTVDPLTNVRRIRSDHSAYAVVFLDLTKRWSEPPDRRDNLLSMTSTLKPGAQRALMRSLPFICRYPRPASLSAGFPARGIRQRSQSLFSLDAERNDRPVRLRIAVLGASAKIVIPSMSLADLASLASSVAVVVTLVFLGLQIRQSNRNQRSLMQQGRSARNVELLSRLSDPRISDVISRAANGESLTDQDCFVLYGYLTSVFWSYEDCFFQFHLGMLDPKSWASDGTTLRRLLGNPAYRAVWRFARGGIGDEYRSFLDGLAAESKHNVPPNLPNTLRQYIAEERETLQRSQDVRP